MRIVTWHNNIHTKNSALKIKIHHYKYWSVTLTTQWLFIGNSNSLYQWIFVSQDIKKNHWTALLRLVAFDCSCKFIAVTYQNFRTRFGYIFMFLMCTKMHKFRCHLAKYLYTARYICRTLDAAIRNFYCGHALGIVSSIKQQTHVSYRVPWMFLHEFTQVAILIQIGLNFFRLQISFR